MKIQLFRCCWFDSLRTACFLIGIYLLVFSTAYLVSIPLCKVNRTPKDDTQMFIHKYGMYISVPSALVNLVAGVLVFLSILKKKPKLMLAAVLVYLIYTLACLPLAIWAIVYGSLPLFLSFQILTVINISFEMMLFSYYIEMRKLETRARSRESSYTSIRRSSHRVSTSRTSKSLPASQYNKSVMT